MKKVITLKAIDSEEELFINDLIDSNLVEIGIGYAPWQAKSVKFDIEQLEKLRNSIARLIFKKRYRNSN